MRNKEKTSSSDFKKEIICNENVGDGAHTSRAMLFIPCGVLESHEKVWPSGKVHLAL